MTGKIIKLVKPPKIHDCAPPSMFTPHSWEQRYDVGTIWQCKCGNKYELGHSNKIRKMYGLFPEWILSEETK